MKKKIVVCFLVFIAFSTFNLGATSCLETFSDSLNLASLNLASELEECSHYIWPLYGPCNDEANLSYNSALNSAENALCICSPAWC